MNYQTIFAKLSVLGLILFMLDAVFLYSTSSIVLPVYQNIQKMPVTMRYGSAALCYLIMVCGLYYFIIREGRSAVDAFFLGIFVYGVYDLTVLSVFKNYTVGIAIMDIMWGGILFSLSTILFRKLIR
jgi:uncharacterized membrane protein